MATVTRVISPEAWRERQIKTLQAVGEINYKVGIAKPRKDPIEAGIAAEEKYAANTKKAIDEGRRAAALGKTSMAEWYKYSSDIGAGRLVDGVVKRVAKVDRFIREFQPMLVGHLASIDVLPDVTDSDREQRMLENLRGLKALKGRA